MSRSKNSNVAREGSLEQRAEALLNRTSEYLTTHFGERAVRHAGEIAALAGGLVLILPFLLAVRASRALKADFKPINVIEGILAAINAGMVAVEEGADDETGPERIGQAVQDFLRTHHGEEAVQHEDEIINLAGLVMPVVLGYIQEKASANIVEDLKPGQVERAVYYTLHQAIVHRREQAVQAA